MRVKIIPAGDRPTFELDDIEELSFVNNDSYGPARQFDAGNSDSGLFVNFAQVVAVKVEEEE